jgi:hypothetical protein
MIQKTSPYLQVLDFYLKQNVNHITSQHSGITTLDLFVIPCVISASNQNPQEICLLHAFKHRLMSTIVDKM